MYLLRVLAQFHPHVGLPAGIVKSLAKRSVSGGKGELSTDSLASAVWALCVMRSPDTAAPLCAALRPRLAAAAASALPAAVQRKLYHAHIMAQDAGVTLDLPEDFINSSLAAWLGAQNKGEGRVHDRVMRALQALELDCKAGQRTDDGVMHVPIVVRAAAVRPLLPPLLSWQLQQRPLRPHRLCDRGACRRRSRWPCC